MAEFKLPDPGEGLVEAEIVTWRVAVGDQVKINDILVEIETSKSLVELPSPYAGTVAALLVPEGTMADVGAPIISITTADEPVTPAAPAVPAEGEKRVPNLVGYGPKTASSSRRPRRAAAGSRSPANQGVVESFATDHEVSRHTEIPEPLSGQQSVATGDPLPAPGADPAGPTFTADTAAAPVTAHALAKPPVRKYAKDHGVDLNAVRGTGTGGVITRSDVDAFLAAPPTEPASHLPEPASLRPEPASLRPEPVEGGEIRIPIKGVRKATADAMVRSAFTAPHVTEWVTIDISATVELVERLRGRREFGEVKVTPTLVIAKAVCLALARSRDLNASWQETTQEIVQHGVVNLGIAAATPRGLVVPNIKSADRLSLLELGAAFTELVATARAGRTQPAAMAGGTFTITNVGSFGVDAGTPILNPGESGILCVGAISRRPWVVGTGVDEQIVPRWVTTLAVSFDHRIADGEQGSRFLADVASILTDPGLGLLF